MVTNINKRKARLSVTVEPELKEIAETVAREHNTTTSGLISRFLEEIARSRKEAALKQYYQAMAGEHRDFAEGSAAVIRKIAAAWSE